LCRADGAPDPFQGLAHDEVHLLIERFVSLFEREA
jgi:hypothetical protein